jgi:hypothetical protein
MNSIVTHTTARGISHRMTERPVRARRDPRHAARHGAARDRSTAAPSNGFGYRKFARSLPPRSAGAQITD